jgi:hypothetical protein
MRSVFNEEKKLSISIAIPTCSAPYGPNRKRLPHRRANFSCLPSTAIVLEGHRIKMEFEVAKKKKIVRREYTKADVKELRAHSKAKTPLVKIMKLTKRTEGSLRQKALKLGIRLGHRR